ncbi:MAG: thiamine pyrophosphate-dependent enzyme [Candidatus Acidiferrum sp.]
MLTCAAQRFHDAFSGDSGFARVAEACGAAGYTIEDPEEALPVLREALANKGPAVVQAVVDANEPLLPGKITTEQTVKFTESLVRGERDGWQIFKNVMEEKVREVI